MLLWLILLLMLVPLLTGSLVACDDRLCQQHTCGLKYDWLHIWRLHQQCRIQPKS